MARGNDASPIDYTCKNTVRHITYWTKALEGFDLTNQYEVFSQIMIVSTFQILLLQLYYFECQLNFLLLFTELLKRDNSCTKLAVDNKAQKATSLLARDEIGKIIRPNKKSICILSAS